MRAVLSTFLVCYAFFSASSHACRSPPSALFSHHSELVATSKNIVLAQVVGSGKRLEVFGGHKRRAAKFVTIEVLKGKADPFFSLPNGSIAGTGKKKSQDFDGHRDAIFWDKHITRQWNTPDCRMYPVFYLNRTYLLFLDHPHWRAYEEIRTRDDLWLAAVRRLVDDPSLSSGVSMSLGEWLGMTNGVFIGEVQSCRGPTLSVERALLGSHSGSWRYSMNDDAAYWPMKTCTVGTRFVVISYASEPSLLPYYSSIIIPIKNGEADFGPAIAESEIDIQGEMIRRMDELERSLLLKEE